MQSHNMAQCGNIPSLQTALFTLPPNYTTDVIV